ncbi:MAG: HigA family addiction module antidote protein [Proteobacteria bacterium]|nr:HigA family addiction module antidote protein [Pseudomonadota bacterium]
MWMLKKGARILGVSRQALNSLVNGKSGISPEMSFRLSKALGSSSSTWLKMQLDYDLAKAWQPENQLESAQRQEK